MCVCVRGGVILVGELSGSGRQTGPASVRVWQGDLEEVVNMSGDSPEQCPWV